MTGQGREVAGKACPLMVALAMTAMCVPALAQSSPNTPQTGPAVMVAAEPLPPLATQPAMPAPSALPTTVPPSVPAATAPSQPADLNGLFTPPTGDTQTDLRKAHRSHDELARWLTERVARLFTFSPGSTAQDLEQARRFFTPAAYQAYLAFLGQQPYADGLRQQAIQVTAVVNAEPLLIGQGASSQRYAWAFEMPVLVSFRPANDTIAEHKHMTLRIQIGRSASGDPQNSVLIESLAEFIEPKEDSGQTTKDP